jgi:hypothetical protein
MTPEELQTAIQTWLTNNPNATPAEMAAVIRAFNAKGGTQVTADDLYKAVPDAHGLWQPVVQALDSQGAIFDGTATEETQAPGQKPTNLLGDIAANAAGIIQQNPNGVTNFGNMWDRNPADRPGGAGGTFNNIVGYLTGVYGDNALTAIDQLVTDGKIDPTLTTNGTGGTGGTSTIPGGGGFDVAPPPDRTARPLTNSWQPAYWDRETNEGHPTTYLRGGGLVSIKQDPVIKQYMTGGKVRRYSGGSDGGVDSDGYDDGGGYDDWVYDDVTTAGDTSTAGESDFSLSIDDANSAIQDAIDDNVQDTGSTYDESHGTNVTADILEDLWGSGAIDDATYDRLTGELFGDASEVGGGVGDSTGLLKGGLDAINKFLGTSMSGTDLAKFLLGAAGAKAGYDSAKESNERMKQREEEYKGIITPIREGLVQAGAGVVNQQGALQSMLNNYMKPGFTTAPAPQRTAQPIKPV